MRNGATFVVILALGVLMAWSSAFSAARMAPDRATVQLESYALIFGSSVGDLCGQEAAHDHRCPLCHGLPEAPASTYDGKSSLLVPHEAWQRRDDLHRAAQARNPCHSPRAPPVRV
ncbi:hypothetical protein KUW09_17200 [Mameliella alba]|nr:hypothetical protein [Antarctobacter heliothermus]MBY6145794.1 hypothetical protein [Mameliella alba]MCA0954789.1 hypothetical protein [Mameliella alba]